MKFLKDFKPVTLNDNLNLSLLKTPIGKKNSGYKRYAAAMHFFNNGLISENLLEIYRSCCKFDKQDPLKIAKLQKIIL